MHGSDIVMWSSIFMLVTIIVSIIFHVGKEVTRHIATAWILGQIAMIVVFAVFWR
jgi:hypothetical protein